MLAYVLDLAVAKTNVGTYEDALVAIGDGFHLYSPSELEGNSCLHLRKSVVFRMSGRTMM